MALMLEDLLDVARIATNKFEIRRKLFDLRETVPDIYEEVQAWFDERKVELIAPETMDEEILVDGDKARLLQVQVNLLTNAAKYTPAGGKVWYTLSRDDTHAVIHVRDTGVGLTKEMCAKIFDPFVQADVTLDRSVGGIGVGLTLVRSIIDRHDGTVQAFSNGPGPGQRIHGANPSCEL